MGHAADGAEAAAIDLLFSSSTETFLFQSAYGHRHTDWWLLCDAPRSLPVGGAIHIPQLQLQLRTLAASVLPPDESLWVCDWRDMQTDGLTDRHQIDALRFCYWRGQRVIRTVIIVTEYQSVKNVPGGTDVLGKWKSVPGKIRIRASIFTSIFMLFYINIPFKFIVSDALRIAITWVYLKKTILLFYLAVPLI